MTAAEWFQGFLFDDVNGWLTGAESTMSMRAFRTAMSGDECMRAFNSLHALIAIEGTRDEVSKAVAKLLAYTERTAAVLETAGL